MNDSKKIKKNGSVEDCHTITILIIINVMTCIKKLPSIKSEHWIICIHEKKTEDYGNN